MTGDELVNKILSHERDFSGIKLENFNFKKHKKIGELSNYLGERSEGVDLEKEPFDFSYSEFYNVDFFLFYAPHSRAYKTDFIDSKFFHVDLRGVDNTGGSFIRSTLQYVRTKDMVVTRTLFEETKFLEYVELKYMENPEDAIYKQNYVLPDQYEYIKKHPKIETNQFKPVKSVYPFPF